MSNPNREHINKQFTYFFDKHKIRQSLTPSAQGYRFPHYFEYFAIGMKKLTFENAGNKEKNTPGEYQSIESWKPMISLFKSRTL